MSNLRTDEGLRQACKHVQANAVDEDWLRRLRAFLGDIRGASLEQRASQSFQARLWDENPISSAGMGTIKMERALDDPGFRRWVAEQSLRELPRESTARTEVLRELYEETLRRLEPFCNRKPHLKIFRVLAAMFPLDFTTLADRSALRLLGLKMLGTGKKEDPVATHAGVMRRLVELLGPVDPENVDEVVARLTLPWMLYAYTREAEEQPTVVTTSSGEEKLKPLPAVRRRRGLTAMKGSFVEMLSILEFVREKPTREELFDHLRATNPTKKDSSIKLIANILRSEFGVIADEGGHYVLSDRGAAVLDSADPADLRDWLLTRVLGVDHILVSLQSGPMDLVSMDRMLMSVNPGWTTNFAPRSTLGWVRSLGLIDRNAAGLMELTENGREWAELIDWVPESLPPENPDETVTLPVDPMAADMEPPELSRILEEVSKVAAFAPDLVASLHYGLWANERRHFAILTGLSGSGKTLLARAYARAVIGKGVGHAGRLCTLPVQPGWYDPTPLFGYVNPLTRDTYEGTPFLDVLLRATDNPSEPHVVILDEMNLSHPEQYLAPVLSAMETGAELHLHSKGDAEDPYFDGVPGSVAYPSNLFLIGTVNMDETTMGLSDKVLDRAFTLEFWKIDLDRWPHWGKTGLPPQDEALVRKVLGALMQALEPARLHFGWRVIDEVVGFLRRRGSADLTMSLTQALDRVLYAKVLPKLRGEDAPRIRKALAGCEEILKAHDLALSWAKVEELKSDLESMGSARFWR